MQSEIHDRDQAARVEARPCRIWPRRQFLHRHLLERAYREAVSPGQRLNSYIITDRYVQFSFKIETGRKKASGEQVGVDTGVNVLAALFTGLKLGIDIKALIETINRCQYASKRQKKLRRALKQRIDLERLRMACEWNRVSYRTVPPYKTSQQWSECGHTEQGNRLSWERFRCRRCGYADDADVNAARNILSRFLTGAYGPGSQTNSVACPT
ncbi:MAG: transposase [Acidobacteria bacterium]|nr:transposase [Acidobacteriota bacterium]